MNKQELREKYEELYNQIVGSNDRAKMEVLGSVVKKQMEWFIDNRPDEAEAYIETLCAVKWDNYLTYIEAQDIVSHMEPQPYWTEEQMMRGLKELGYPTEEAPYYNSHALYAAISMKFSDSGRTIAEQMMGKSLREVENHDMLRMCYHLALDVLKDRDGRFNIRRYFEV